MTESAQVFKGVHDIPVYTDILFNKPLRLWVAISLYGGTRRHHRAHHLDARLRARPRHADLRPTDNRRRRRRGRADATRAAHLRVPATQHLARPAPRGGHQHQRPPARTTAHHHRQPQFHRARRLRPLPAQRAALLPAVHQTPHRRRRPPPDPLPRNPRRHMGLRALRAPKPAPAGARYAARPPRQTALGQRLPPDGPRHRPPKPPHPHLLAGHARRRRPRRTQPGRPSHQTARLGDRT